MRSLPAYLSLRLAIGFSLALITMAPFKASAQIVVSIAPPQIPVDVQPASPGVAFVWAPGHWGRNASGYAWVHGSWLMPPSSGMLWTPGYWRPQSGGFAWQPGRWGSTVGYYGGVNYGFGYAGSGFTSSTLRHDELRHEVQHYREDNGGKPGGPSSYPGDGKHNVPGPQPEHVENGHTGRPNLESQTHTGSTAGGGNPNGNKTGASSASGEPAGSGTPSKSPASGRSSRSGAGAENGHSGGSYSPR